MRRHPLLTLVLAALLLPAIIGTPRAIAVERPPRLAPSSGCELWVGRASGNDPSTQVELQLCPRPDGSVSGSLQWSSTLSGWNIRDVSGRYEPGGTTLLLRDERVREERPEPGWRFCTVDRYTFERSGDHMRGRFHSGACHDDGTITLERAASAPAQPAPAQQPAVPGATPPPAMPSPGTPSPVPLPGIPSPTPAPSNPPPPPSRGPFGCSV